jgi:hypothetical protein
MRDLETYYGGNANNQRYLEGLAAAKAAPEASAPAPVTLSTREQEIAAAQAALDSLTSIEQSLNAVPPVPESPPVWKAKA